MVSKARLGLYLKDEETKKQIKVAAIKRGMSTTAYCAQAIEERLIRDEERTRSMDRNKIALLSRMDKLRQEIGVIGISTAELVEKDRRR